MLLKMTTGWLPATALAVMLSSYSDAYHQLQLISQTAASYRRRNKLRLITLSPFLYSFPASHRQAS